MISNLYLSLYLNIKSINMGVKISNSDSSTLKIRYDKSYISIGNNIHIKSKIFFLNLHVTLPLKYKKYNFGISANKNFKKFNTKLYGIAYTDGIVNLSLYSFYNTFLLDHKFKPYVYIKSNNFIISNVSFGVTTKINILSLSLIYSILNNNFSIKVKYIHKPLNVLISFKDKIDVAATICVDV